MTDIFTTTASTAIPEATSTDMEVLVAAQKRIEFKIDEYGGLLLKQYCWPDKDQEIYINSDYIDMFIDKLTDAVGVPSMGRQ